MKLTRHNGRSGKNGTYNPRHNDRRFDVGNSEHIDTERAKRNIYWDCYRGFTTAESREDTSVPDFSFEQIEKAFYVEHYSDHVNAQNARNEKTRHTERNRTVEDLLKNKKTCPEESIYQIGTVEESVPPEILFKIVNEFYEEFEKRFGSCIHILDWALHLDEGTPHIHERHVFDCENRYGEICPQQEKALEKLGVPLPDLDKPKSRNNNRKQTFDAVCRTMLFDIAKKHGLHLDAQPEIAYEKAVDAVTDTVRAAAQKEDVKMICEYKDWLMEPERKAPKDKREYAAKRLDTVIEKIMSAAQKTAVVFRQNLMKPEVRKAGTEQVREKARESVLERLARGKIGADRKNREHLERQRQTETVEKDNREM